MWHEARKQERKIRGMLVDYRKRAERRQDFYEKIVSLAWKNVRLFLKQFTLNSTLSFFSYLN